MSLSFSSLLLLAASFSLSVSAPTPEECKPLITPLSLADPSVLYGRVNFMVGYTDNDIYDNILKTTKSNWLNFTSSPSGTNEVVMYEENNINGTCIGSTLKFTIDGDTATLTVANLTTSFHLLPSCDGCLLLSCNSTVRDVSKFLTQLNINMKVPEEELVAHGLYLMAKGTTVKDSDLEHFKKQASCLGFSGEPDFHYDPEQGFCKEDEVMKVEFH